MESKLFDWLAKQPECFHICLQEFPPVTLHWDAWSDCAVLVCEAIVVPFFQGLINNGHVSGLSIAVRYHGEAMRVDAGFCAPKPRRD